MQEAHAGLLNGTRSRGPLSDYPDSRGGPGSSMRVSRSSQSLPDLAGGRFPRHGRSSSRGSEPDIPYRTSPFHGPSVSAGHDVHHQPAAPRLPRATIPSTQSFRGSFPEHRNAAAAAPSGLMHSRRDHASMGLARAPLGSSHRMPAAAMQPAGHFASSAGQATSHGQPAAPFSRFPPAQAPGVSPCLRCFFFFFFET